jgi:hypothetical protein
MRRKVLSGKVVGSLACALVAFVTATAQAAITYVDATDGVGGNTTLTNGNTWTAIDPPGQGAAGDGVWAERVFGNGATIFQNAASGTTDNAHRLLTTISGLSPGGVYDVYVYFWSDPSTWRINAGVTDSTLPQFAAQGGHADPTTANTTRLAPAGTADGTLLTTPGDPFTTAVMIAEGNRRLYQGYLGQDTADGSGLIQVYVDDDLPVQGDQNQRTWYEGVGYAAVPEPASVALLGLGGVAVLYRRRR